MKKRLFLLFLALCLPLIGARALPEWPHPLAANLLENRNGNLTLVNRQALLAADFVPNNLVSLSGLRSVSGPHMLRKEAALALMDMFAAAEEAGHTLYVKSSYRSYGTQDTMYHNRLEKYNRDDGVVAFPGSSDHQTGLGVDVLNWEWANQDGMRPEFGNTAEARWMEAHCAEFGFIIRYLPEKQEITGIIYEPWHLRYMGREVARYIMDNRLSLEEFDQEVRQAIMDYEAVGGDFAALCAQLNALPPPKELAETDEAGDSDVSIFYQP
ncbi:MAG: M15 family metallopeptidase [Clostridiales bacterium]|nr:M15 family metallopeptidase [Clostridiales bacterium]